MNLNGKFCQGQRSIQRNALETIEHFPQIMATNQKKTPEVNRGSEGKAKCLNIFQLFLYFQVDFSRNSNFYANLLLVSTIISIELNGPNGYCSGCAEKLPETTSLVFVFFFHFNYSIKEKFEQIIQYNICILYQLL